MIRICRICGKKSSETSFKNNRNLCKSCAKIQLNNWKIQNKSHVDNYYKTTYFTPKYKAMASARIIKAWQSSPERFIGYLWQHIKTRKPKLLIEIDYNFLVKLYYKQERRCAILNIPMTHEFHNLRDGKRQCPISFSIHKYGKMCHTNEECTSVLDEYLRIKQNLQENL